MFGRSPGKVVKGPQNRSIRDKRGRDGQVIVEKQTRSLWGTLFGEWKTEKAFPNKKSARNYTNKKRR